MATVASPLKPPPADINRIVRARDVLGTENLYDALAPLVLHDKPPSVRALAASLNVAVGTAWKLKKSLPLADISNQSHVMRRATLRDIITSPQKIVTPSVHPAPHQYLTNVETEVLVQLIDTRAHNQHAIGMSGIRQYAADLRAQRLRVARVELPSRSWYYNFEQRHLKESFRPLKPAAREYKRANAERAHEIEKFFAELKKLYDKHQYPAHCLWAADETGLEGDATSRERVQVPRSLKQGMVVKGSFRDHVSALHMCNAAGVNLPPIFSFIGEWFNPALLEGAPVGSKTAMQENGYFTQSHMLGFIQHMVEYMDSEPQLYRENGDVNKPRLPSLLILDGAATHVSADAWQYAMDHSVGITFLPPNLTHIMQVSDVSVFGPFKIAYRNECDAWRHAHRDREMDKFDIAGVTGKAWQKAMTSANAISGFRKTGQWPLNPAAVLNQVHTHTLLSLPARLGSTITHFSFSLFVLCLAQLNSSEKQMALRRSLSDITRLEMQLETAESENRRLREEIEQLRRTAANSEVVADVSAAVGANMTLGEFLTRESRPHPSAAAKKVKKVSVSKKGYLKGVAAGQLLTQPHIIAGIKEHEDREKASAERKAADKVELQTMRKQARASAAVEKKRKAAAHPPPARGKRAARASAAEAEGESEGAPSGSESVSA